MIIVYITCKDKDEATNISRMLLEKKLIGCANIFAVNSMYLWKGKIVKAKEHMIVAKSLTIKAYAIQKEVKKHHSYSVPSIEIICAKASKEYTAWLIDEMQKAKAKPK